MGEAQTRIKDGERVAWRHAGRGVHVTLSGVVVAFVPRNVDCRRCGVEWNPGTREVRSRKPRYLVQTARGILSPNASTVDRQNPTSKREAVATPGALATPGEMVTRLRERATSNQVRPSDVRLMLDAAATIERHATRVSLTE